MSPPAQRAGSKGFRRLVRSTLEPKRFTQYRVSEAFERHTRSYLGARVSHALLIHRRICNDPLISPNIETEIRPLLHQFLRIIQRRYARRCLEHHLVEYKAPIRTRTRKVTRVERRLDSLSYGSTSYQAHVRACTWTIIVLRRQIEVSFL